MTIEMTPLEELDFPTPDLTEAWEPTPDEVTAFTDWFDAEASYKAAVSEWVAAELSYEMKRLNQLAREYQGLVMSNSERCYCSPSRGMMFDPLRYDIYGSCGGNRADVYAQMNADLEAQIEQLKAENARAARRAVERVVPVTMESGVAPSRPWWRF